MNAPTTDEYTVRIELAPLPDAARLVATFPLNGRPASGYRIWIVDEQTDDERYAVADEHQYTHTPAVRYYPNIARAVAYCLRGSGWGSFTITEQVDR